MTTHSTKPGAKGKAAKLVRVSTKRSGLLAPKKASATNFVRVYRLGPAERIALVKHGVPAGDVVKMARSIGKPKEHLMKVLGLPRATVDRRARADKQLSKEHGERLIGLAKLVGQVQVMVEKSGDPTGFDPAKWVGDWLEKPVPALGGRCPGEYMDTAEGQELVSRLLAQMQSGAYA